jgi:hypothetical protein
MFCLFFPLTLVFKAILDVVSFLTSWGLPTIFWIILFLEIAGFLQGGKYN